MSLLPSSSHKENWRHLSMALRGFLGDARDGAGVQLLDRYDPDKRPLVLLHGLGSSPLVWEQLTAALKRDAALRARFQVWRVLYQTNAPAIVVRRRVQGYLDDVWRILDPQHRDPARAGIVLVGHSFGGVIARLLSVDTGMALWDAAFTVPPERVKGDPDDLRSVEATYLFNAYPGITHLIFLATPHRGSPHATTAFGNLMRHIVGRRTPEIRILGRVAHADPDAVKPSLRALYQGGLVNSITSLDAMQPVRVAGQALMPRKGIVYHTIAAALPGRDPKTDGAVPLDSTVIEGAASTLVIEGDHHLYNHPAAVGEVLRILRDIE
jgi:pimeloyl-ACP methyl ester carboxylesterase